MDDVEFFGLNQEIRLTDTSPQDPMQMAVWDLFQVPAGGVFLLPFIGDTFEYVDYYAPSLNSVLAIEENYARIHVDSCAEHKIGAKSFNTFGRIGYLRQENEQNWTLLVRNYRNDPSDANIKEPSDQPGETGCSLFVYMNDTRGDGLAELETTGSTLCAPDTTESELFLNDWFFSGTFENLRKIVRQLLGIKSLSIEGGMVS
jgi:hypothetical protein